MFKAFTWAKFAGWLVVAAAFVTSPMGGLLGIATAKLGAIGAILTGVSSLITTNKAGTATDANGAQINGAPPAR